MLGSDEQFTQAMLEDCFKAMPPHAIAERRALGLRLRSASDQIAGPVAEIRNVMSDLAHGPYCSAGLVSERDFAINAMVALGQLDLLFREMAGLLAFDPSSEGVSQ